MVSVMTLVEYMKENFPDLNIYPLELPLNSPDNSVLIEVQAGTAMVANMFEANVQIKVRDTHPLLAEKTSQAIRGFLENKTDMKLNTTQVLLIKSVNPIPLYIGRDATDLFLFSNNFRFIMNEGDI